MGRRAGTFASFSTAAVQFEEVWREWKTPQEVEAIQINRENGKTKFFPDFSFFIFSSYVPLPVHFPYKFIRVEEHYGMESWCGKLENVETGKIIYNTVSIEKGEEEVAEEDLQVNFLLNLFLLLFLFKVFLYIIFSLLIFVIVWRLEYIFRDFFCKFSCWRFKSNII